MGSRNRRYTMEIAEWVSQLRYEEIPERVVERSKLQIMSVLGAIFGSSRIGAGRRATDAVRRLSDAGASKMIPYGDCVSLRDALTANSCLSMMLDYDDYLFAGHTGHSAVLTPLALAERMEVDGKQLIAALTAANEVEARIGGSVMAGPLNGQMWAFIHSAGAACAAANLFGLDEARTANALGMSLSQPARPLTPGFMGADSKLFTAAGIHTGLLAAQFAAEGMEGPRDILEVSEGFCETFSFVPIYPMLTRLGECWLSDTLCFKIYPGCAYIDAAMDCVFGIIKENEVDTDEIFKIDVYASLPTVKMDEMSRPYVRYQQTHPVALNFYTPYNVAVGILDRALGPEQFEPERIRDQRVWDLAKRVRVHHDMALTGKVIESVTDLLDLRYMLGELRAGSLRRLIKNIGPGSPLVWLAAGREIMGFMDEGRRAMDKIFGRPSEEKAGMNLAESAENFRMAFGARVVFEMKSERKSYEKEQEVPYGAAGRPLDELRRDVSAKFDREARVVLRDDAAEAAFDKINNLEKLDSAGVRSLISDCCSVK
jgi:2-methylcitrate dehydratase PrpD